MPLLLLLAAGCVHEVRRAPAPSLLPRGKVAVIGEVGRGGLIDYVPGMTVLEALRAVGGLSAMANADASVLTRSVSGLTASTSVHLGAISDGREPDVPLEEGDLVQVPSQAEVPLQNAAPRLPSAEESDEAR